MSITIKDKDESKIQIPKTKQVEIGTIAVGEIEPSIVRDTLRWHACIKANYPHRIRGWVPLLQGFGTSPTIAVADAIVSARRELAEFREYLAQVEKECGTTACSEQELIAQAEGRDQ